MGNTLIIVEHDREVIASSDGLFDFGPGDDTQSGTFFLSLCQGGTSLNQQRFEFGAPATWTVGTTLTTTVSNQYHYAITWSATGGPNGGGYGGPSRGPPCG